MEYNKQALPLHLSKNDHLMIKKTIHHTWRIADILHTKLLGYPMSEEVRKFVRNLGWVFWGMIIAKALFFIAHLVGGRVLGAAVYGELSLIITIAGFFLLPLTIATGGVSRYIAESHDEEEKRTIATTGTIGAAALLIATLLLPLPFLGEIATLAKTTLPILWGAWGLALLWACGSWGEGMFSGFRQFQAFSKATIWSHCGMILVFLGLLFIGTKHISLLLLPIGVQYLLLALWALAIFWKAISARFSWEWMKKIWHYGAFTLLSSTIVLLLNSIDRIMLNYWHGPAVVGEYQAYYFGSIVVSGVFLDIFQRVLSPTLFGRKDQHTFLPAMLKLFFPIGVYSFLLLPIQLWIIITLYAFPFSLLTTGLFSLLTFLATAMVLLNALYLSISATHVKRITALFGAGLLLNVGLNIWLIPLYGNNGAVVATICAYAGIIFFQLRTLRKKKITSFPPTEQGYFQKEMS